jgi:hypothetical protein
VRIMKKLPVVALGLIALTLHRVAEALNLTKVNSQIAEEARRRLLETQAANAGVQAANVPFRDRL